MSNELSPEEEALWDKAAEDEADGKDTLPSVEDIETSSQEEVEKKELEQPANEQIPDTPQEEGDDLADEPFEVLKYHGKEFEVKSYDELLELSQKGLDYTAKTTGIAKWKGMISAMEENDLTEDDINMLIASRNGDANAVSALAQKGEIDIYDVNELDEEYEPDNYIKEVDPILESIQQDEEGMAKTIEMSNLLPDEFNEQIANNPQMLGAFYNDVKNGYAEAILPEAIRRHQIRGGDFLPYYQGVYKELAEQQEQQVAQPEQPNYNGQQQPQQQAVEPDFDTAGIPNISNGSPAFQDANDVWAMSDEDFEKRLQSVMQY